MDTFNSAERIKMAQEAVPWEHNDSHCICMECHNIGEFTGYNRHGVYTDHVFKCDNCGITWCYISEHDKLLRLQVEFKKI